MAKCPAPENLVVCEKQVGLSQVNTLSTVINHPYACQFLPINCKESSKLAQTCMSRKETFQKPGKYT